jgi:pyruvate/2-oxoglutarate dehydrogenase complex dihydrolipoamide acyltransferase (E2) component
MPEAWHHGYVTRAQKRHYALAVGLIVLGFICAVVSTGTIGGALATVFVALGLLLFLGFLFRDLGLTVDSKPRRRVPIPPEPAQAEAEAEPPPPASPPPAPAPPADAPHAAAPHAAAPRPDDGGRPRATVRRPERLRGDRRRPDSERP